MRSMHHRLADDSPVQVPARLVHHDGKNCLQMREHQPPLAVSGSPKAQYGGTAQAFAWWLADLRKGLRTAAAGTMSGCVPTVRPRCGTNHGGGAMPGAGCPAAPSFCGKQALPRVPGEDV